MYVLVLSIILYVHMYAYMFHVLRNPFLSLSADIVGDFFCILLDYRIPSVETTDQWVETNICISYINI